MRRPVYPHEHWETIVGQPTPCCRDAEPCHDRPIRARPHADPLSVAGGPARPLGARRGWPEGVGPGPPRGRTRARAPDGRVRAVRFRNKRRRRRPTRRGRARGSLLAHGRPPRGRHRHRARVDRPSSPNGRRHAERPSRSRLRPQDARGVDRRGSRLPRRLPVDRRLVGRRTGGKPPHRHSHSATDRPSHVGDHSAHFGRRGWRGRLRHHPHHWRHRRHGSRLDRTGALSNRGSKPGRGRAVGRSGSTRPPSRRCHGRASRTRMGNRSAGRAVDSGLPARSSRGRADRGTRRPPAWLVQSARRPGGLSTAALLRARSSRRGHGVALSPHRTRRVRPSRLFRVPHGFLTTRPRAWP